jgi:hypothetical protein
VIVARWGDVAISVRIEAYQPVPVKLVESLMAAQATCMTSTSSCAPIQEPDGLANLGASQT